MEKINKLNTLDITNQPENTEPEDTPTNKEQEQSVEVREVVELEANGSIIKLGSSCINTLALSERVMEMFNEIKEKNNGKRNGGTMYG